MDISFVLDIFEIRATVSDTESDDFLKP